MNVQFFQSYTFNFDFQMAYVYLSVDCNVHANHILKRKEKIRFLSLTSYFGMAASLFYNPKASVIDELGMCLRN